MDWKRIKAQYVAGGVSLRELSEKHGVSFSTIQKKSMEEKWSDLRKKQGRKTEEKLIEAVSNQEVKKAVDIIDVADKLLEKASELMEMPLTTQSFKQLTSALKDLKEIKGYKSDADIREQEARIKKLEQELNADNKDTTVIVRIDDDANKWNK